MPPLFERDLRLRSRMAHSSYEYMFAKPAMRFLFDDYVQPLGRAWLSFRPSEVRCRATSAGPHPPCGLPGAARTCASVAFPGQQVSDERVGWHGKGRTDPLGVVPGRRIRG